MYVSRVSELVSKAREREREIAREISITNDKYLLVSTAVEASVQWALSTLKLEASASAADIESATRALLDHPAGTSRMPFVIYKLEHDG